MELKLNKNAPVSMVTVVREFDQTKLEAHHSVRWVPTAGCPDGYILQRIKRDTKITPGRRDGQGGLSWDKNPSKVDRGDYYELWEVIKSGVYPCKAVGGLLFSDGRVYSEGNDVPEAYIRGPGVADYAKRPLYHDNFGIKPKGGRIFKGTAKILGEVFFLPKTQADTMQWMKDFKKLAKRNVQHGVFWGGILLTRASSDVSKLSDSFKVMTRYEAAEFIEITDTERRMGTNAQGKKEPQTRDSKSRYIGDRAYPGFGRKAGQGIVSTRYAGASGGWTYKAGSNAGPPGTLHTVQQMKTKGKWPGGMSVDRGDWVSNN